MVKEYFDKEIGKTMRLHDDIEEVKQELQKVADEMGLPIEDERVPLEWCNRLNCYTKEVDEKFIIPFYKLIPV